MINKTRYEVYFKTVKNNLRMIKRFTPVFESEKRNLYSKLRLVEKKTKCSICNASIYIAFETSSYGISHNFCCACVNDRFVPKKMQIRGYENGNRL